MMTNTSDSGLRTPRRTAWTILVCVMLPLMVASPARAASGGEDVDPGEFTGGMVSLQQYDTRSEPGWRHYCGGSVLSATTILTSAACVINRTLTDFAGWRVAFGSAVLSGAEAFREVLDFQIHPKSNGSGLWDAAVVTLRSPLPPSATPVRLPARADSGVTSPGQWATLYAWGNTAPGVPTDRLQKASQVFTEHEPCERRYGDLFYSSASSLCVAPTGVTFQYGDSGSPLVRSLDGSVVQVGIAGESYTATDPNAYTAASNELVDEIEVPPGFQVKVQRLINDRYLVTGTTTPGWRVRAGMNPLGHVTEFVDANEAGRFSFEYVGPDYADQDHPFWVIAVSDQDITAYEIWFDLPTPQDPFGFVQSRCHWLDPDPNQVAECRWG